MSLSMYQASAPVFVTMLNNLSAILEKAEAYGKDRKIDESVLLNWRFAPDMFPLTRQVQISTDFAKAPRPGSPASKSPNMPMTRQVLPGLGSASPKR